MQVRLWPNTGHHLWNKSLWHYASAHFLKNDWKLDWELIQGTICTLDVVANEPEVCSGESELWERGLPQGVDQWARDWLACQIKIRPLFHHLIPVNLLRRNLGRSGLLMEQQKLHSLRVFLICACTHVDTTTCRPSLVSVFKSGLLSSLRWSKVAMIFFFFSWFHSFFC